MDEEKDLGWQLKRTTDAVKLYVNRFIKSCLAENDVSISWTEGAILAYVSSHQDEVVSAKLLMGKLQLSKATMSQTLSSLVCKGLIEYEEWEEDGRVKRILATKKAKNLWEQTSAIMKKADTYFKSAFTDDEYSQIIHLLDKLSTHVEKFNDIQT